MEFVIIYVYTIILTTIIGLRDSGRRKAKIPISKWKKIVLLLWTSKREISIYFLMVRIFIQLFTISCLAIVCIERGANYQEIQSIYGTVMIGVVIPVTILEKIKMK